MSKKKINISKKAWLSQGSSEEAKKKRWNSEKKAAHLDKKGKGIFNEVSFNVLENAAEKSNKDKESSNAGYAHRTVTSSDEMLYHRKTHIKHKKTHIKKGQSADKVNVKFKTKIAIVIFVIVLLFAAIGTMYFSGHFGQTQELNSSKILINNIASNDIIIINLDKFLSHNLDENRMEDFYIDEQDITDAIANLKNCRAEAEQIVSESGIGTDENSAASNAINSIDARIDMLECGSYIYKKYKETSHYITISDDMWNKLLDADQLIRQSDELSSKNNDNDLRAAVELDRQAYNLIKEAKAEVVELSSSSLNFDFSNYTKYIDTRLASTAASIASLDALLAQDTETAVAKNNEYVSLEAQAADLAETINTNPSAIIRTNYDIDIKPYIDKYKEARARAAASDSLIRNYFKI